jgi:high affinity Mn2+ porin
LRSARPGAQGRTQASRKETADLTLFLGLRPWRGGEFYVNPEVGFSNLVGASGFPGDDADQVEQNRPDMKSTRVFLRQVFDLEGGSESVEAGPNALAGSLAKNNVTFTVGYFSVGDVFDGNTYAHEPRADFLNGSIIDAGALDMAADAWGFSYGAAAEWQTGDWTFRLGLFALPETPHSAHIDRGFGQRSWMAEVERRYDLFGRHGETRLIGYRNQGRMGAFDEVLRRAAGTAAVPDTADLRRRTHRTGWALNVEQELAAEVGAFLRLSANDGRSESYGATEIHRSVSGGLVFKGALWGQPAHTWGTAVVVNGLSNDAVRYFRAGGTGFLVSGGQLPNYGRERILETHYGVKLRRELSVTGDFQRLSNPAYSRDHKPVNVLGLRVHAEF